MAFKVISSSIKGRNFETSVLIPIRRDSRVYNLLKSLSMQKYRGFIVLIANDSKEPCLKKEDFPKNLNYVYYHSPEEKYSTFDKLNFLADKVKTPFVAITESDCEPSKEWLSDLIPIVKREKSVIKGGEARPIGCCTSNLAMPSQILRKIRFDTNIPIVADYEFGMNLAKKGYNFKIINNKGVVFHNLVTGKPRINRIIPCSKDEVAIAFKYRDAGFLFKKILRNGYNIFVGLAQTFLYLIFVPYFLIKSVFKK